MWLNQKRMMTILNKGSNGDKISRGCDFFLSVLIILNLIAVCLESVGSFNNLYKQQLFIFEAFSVSVFLLEYCLRIWSVAADDESVAKRPPPAVAGLSTSFSFTGIIDLLAISCPVSCPW